MLLLTCMALGMPPEKPSSTEVAKPICVWHHNMLGWKVTQPVSHLVGVLI